MSGYIKDHRKELDSDIWQMPPLYHRTWQWLKYNVNHADREIPMKDGSKMAIKRGQRLTSVRDIARGISWYEGRKPKEPNPKTVSAILEWMEKTSMISIERGKGNREYTLITITNYEVYNEKESQGNSKVTLDGEGGKHLADINNNDKELIKNDKKEKDLLKDSVPYSKIIGYLNLKTNSSYKPNSKVTQRHIKARWSEGYRLEEFETVIDKKTAEWLADEKMNQYLRPETLFGSKFENYLNQKIVLKGGQSDAAKPESRREATSPEYNAEYASIAKAANEGITNSANASRNTERDFFDQFVRR